MSIIEEFKVSVIIPVYNAGEFVGQAVESAFNQPETGEIILIEDNSTDDSLTICTELSKDIPNVRLYRHTNGENKGAAASRNLGIRYARFPYISFLDADDYYLPNRFIKTKETFQNKADADGVYESIGTFFQEKETRELFNSVGLEEITTINKEILPEDLFTMLMKGQDGYFTLNGFTAKKEIFSLVGFFDESLKMYEDTMLIYKVSAKRKLYPGNITEPVAIRRVHQGNRITYRLADQRKAYESMLEFWKILFVWGEGNLTEEQLKQLSYRIINYLRRMDKIDDVNLRDFIVSRMKMIKYAFKMPTLLGEYLFWRRILPSRKLVTDNIRLNPFSNQPND